jgi:hypothetical protein
VASTPLYFAASPQPSELFGALLPVLLILVGIVFVGWIAMLMIRRSVRSGSDSLGGSFTLGQLRKLHAAGELNDQEYEDARSVILGQVHPTGSDTELKSPDKAGKQDEMGPEID